MKIYKRNLEALKKTHPHLVQFIEDVEVDRSRMNVVRSRSGEIAVRCEKDDGVKVVIDNSVDLHTMPKRLRELIDKKDGKKVVLLLGFGLGGYAEELHKMVGRKGSVVVYEATPALFKIAIEEKDLSRLFRSKRFNLVLGEDTEDFLFIQQHHREMVSGKFFVLNQRGCIALNESAYEIFRTKLINKKRLFDSIIVTGIQRGAEWMDAVIRNIPIILRTPGVARIAGLFKGRPAIVVSAGPSLEKNFHLLKEAKGRAVIIAVDVVVPTLLPAGIIPDFIVVLEANRIQFRVFEGNPLLRSCPLVCSSEVDYETLSAVYPGPVFLNLAVNHPVLQWLHNFWDDKGLMGQPGGSVSHTAFALALYLGANAIAIIGQDLSFEEKVHAGDVSNLLWGKNHPENSGHRYPVVKDIFGRMRHTMGQFLTFRTSFEDMIKRISCHVVNATEGGIPIEGAATMRLKDFLMEYCNEPIVETFDVLASFGDKPDMYDLPGLLAYIQDGIARFRKVQKNAREIVQSVLRLRELKEVGLLLQNKEAAYLIRGIKKREKLAEDRILKVIAPYRYRKENYLSSDEIDHATFDAIQDSLDYYSELIEVIERFVTGLDTLVDALERESEVDSVLADATVSSIERHYRAGVIHVDTGMVREAVKDFERAADEFTRISESDDQKEYWTLALRIHSLLAELYVKQHRFYEAKEILEVLMGFILNKQDRIDNLDGESVTRLLEVCKHGIARWTVQQAGKEQLLEKACVGYGSYLESGNFYARIGDYERAKGSYSKAVEEANTLLHENIGESMKVSILKARLVASLYGLAQMYLATNDTEKALQALDVGSICALEMDKTAMSHVEETCRLFADLYEKCERSDKALFLYERAISAYPNDLAFRQEIKTFHKKVISLN